jgi:hypothetical protein
MIVGNSQADLGCAAHINKEMSPGDQARIRAILFHA